MTPEQQAERLRQVENDLADLERQISEGEIDAGTGRELAEHYRREAEELVAVETEPSAGSRFRLGGRALVGTLLMGVALVVIAVLVAGAIEDREPGEFVTGNIDGRDLSEVSTQEMEEVVAEFPQVVGMRLALAGRYFDQGDFSAALPHYLAVLEQNPDEPEANANVGWMTFLSDPAQSETAAAFLERSLAAAPGYGQATFYLANVRLYGLDDRAGAEALLTELAAADDLPADVRSTVEDMLVEARS